MNLWDHLSNLSAEDLQDAITIHAMGREIKKLHDEGYSVDADRLLDELHAWLGHLGSEAASLTRTR